MRRQRGTTTVEFAIVGGVVLMILFAVVEFGRLLWSYSMLGESARRAARLAVVCPVGDPKVAAAALYADADVAPAELGAANVKVEYIDEAGAPVADPAAHVSAISQVRVTITGVRFDLGIPFVTAAFTARDFVVVLPRESLGYHAAGVSGAC